MRKFLIKMAGVLTLLVLSFTAKAYHTSLPLLIPTTISFTKDNIADKLAVDAKFIELVTLVVNDEIKIRNLSLEDKGLFKRHAQENRASELIKLYAKCGIDYDKTSLQKRAIIIDLNKKYSLNERSDKKEIIKSALLK